MEAAASVRWRAAPDRREHPVGWWGSFLCWSIVAANGALVLWLLGGLAIGFLSPSHLRNWPFAVGIPITVALLFVVPAMGIAGQIMMARSAVLLPRAAGAAGLGFSTALWILLFTASPGI